MTELYVFRGTAMVRSRRASSKVFGGNWMRVFREAWNS